MRFSGSQAALQLCFEMNLLEACIAESTELNERSLLKYIDISYR